MAYSPALVNAGNRFMIERLAYNPRDDNGHPPQGGSYIGAHLRRRDFLYSRRSTVPSLEGVVSQLDILMQELKQTTVFIASDESMDDECKNICSLVSLYAGYIQVLSFWIKY